MAKSKVTQKKVSLSELNNHTTTNKRQALKDLSKLNFDELILYRCKIFANSIWAITCKLIWFICMATTNYITRTYPCVLKSINTKSLFQTFFLNSHDQDFESVGE